MEFDDAVIGLWGFLLFLPHLFIKAVIKGIQYLLNKTNRKTNDFLDEVPGANQN